MFCEKCGNQISEELGHCQNCALPEEQTKEPEPPKTGIIINRLFERSTVVESNAGAKDGQNKCPKCGSTEISPDKNSGKLRCQFCRHEFDPVNFEGAVGDISKLQIEVFGSGTQDIAADAKDILTFKCQSCGAEVVIDTNEALQAKCHWCRNMLSINEQIANGAIPDMVLPFTITKPDAQKEINDFVHARKFFAHPEFKKQFCSENVMPVYLPYMVIDVNSSAHLSGEGERLTRTRGSGNDQTYDADVFNVDRKFDLVIKGLTIEASKEKLQHLSGEKTNNIINAIKPFDTNNAVKWDPNYLKGCTSEKRDVNTTGLTELVDNKIADISRHQANGTLKVYDRGVRWAKEEINIKGIQWKAAYLPIWLYSYQSVKGDRKVLHYVAVNARTKKTMGSVPINKPKLFAVSAMIQIPCTIIGIYFFWWFVIIDLLGEASFLPLLLLGAGPLFYGAMWKRYRNLCARHMHEEDTEAKMDNIEETDVFVENRKRLSSQHIFGMNNQKVSNDRSAKSWLKKFNIDINDF